MAVSTPQTTAADPVSNNPTAHNDTNQQSTPNTPTAATSSPRVEQRSGSSAGMELKPIGIHNESNTCFLNSTFQALSATAPLTTLLSSSPQSPLSIHANSSLPDPTVHPKLIPSLHPDILEPPLYELLPVTRAFTNSLHRAWRMKEAGGGTYGHGETSSKRSMSLNSLLREIARKYDQYDDYSQQDAHELLRHLLDSMEMEEKDVIKKLQPSNNSHGYGYGNNKRKKSKSNLNSLKSGQTTPSASNTMNSHQQHLMDIKHISPLPSPLPSPANTRPPSPGHRDVDPMAHAVPININGQMTGHAVHEEPIFSPSDTPVESGSEIVQLIPDEERLIPFVDVLFGGSLASVVVCEKCKAVSHTYEGFLDISLSLKGDDPKPRKRDRLRAMARKFRPRKSNTTSSEAQPHSVVSESELSETEGPTEKGRRKSMDSDDRITIDSNNTNSSGLGRSSSTISFGGLKSKPSFSFRRKDKKAASPVIAPSPTFEEDHIKSPATSVPNSPSLYGQGGHGDRKHKHHHKHHGPGPTPAQAAYISRILAPPPGTVDLDDPLAKLRAAQSGQPIEVSPSTSSEYGLIDALRAFTSVEVLEGENAFACKKCWKIKHGYYAKHEATVKEEDEEQLKDEEGFPQTYTRDSVSTASSVGNSPLLMPNARMGSQSHQAPQISVMGSPSSEKSSNSSYWDNDGRLGRSQKNSNNPTIRAPSPLRRQLELEEQEKLNSQMASATLSSTYGSDYSGMTMDSVTSTNTTSSRSIDGNDTSTDNLAEEPEEEDEEEESDGLSDSDTSIDENHHNGPNEDTNLDDGKKKKKKKSKKDKDANKRSHHVVMGRAFKRYLIAKKPEILVFHFKRFKQTAKSYSFSSFYDLKKIDDFVSFPETLDLAPFLAPNRQDYKVNQTPSGPRATYMEWANPEQGPELEPVMYRLYAVVVHLGTMIGGHYIAYCLIDPEQMFGPSAEGEGAENKTPVVEPTDQRSIKSQQSGAAGSGKNKKDRRVWCFCSDTSIRLASIEEVLSQKAYLCFYEKVSQ